MSARRGVAGCAMSARLASSPLAALAIFAALAASLAASAQVPSKALHELGFFVHQDLVDTNGLPYYQAAIDRALDDARLMLQGDNGPADAPCCAEITAAASVAAFGSNGDGFDTLNFDTQAGALAAIASGQPAVFIVDTISLCGGGAGAVGCATTPSCASATALVSAIATGAFDLDILAQTIAHERGHNACLVHVGGSSCRLMQASAGGACLTTTECATLRSRASSTGETCACHASTTTAAADATACSDSLATGICAGGVCGDVGSSASVGLVAAADPSGSLFGAAVGSAVTNDLVRADGLAASWSTPAVFGAGNIRPTGLEYAPERGVLYAVWPSSLTNAELLEIDPASGAVLRTTVLTGRAGLISLAWDPGGAGTADDMLFAVERLANGEEWLRTIDPDTGSVTNNATSCLLVTNSDQTDNGFFQGLAYDAVNDQLLGAGIGGLIEVTPQTGGICPILVIDHPAPGTTFSRDAASLAWSSASGLFYMVGNQTASRTLLDVIEGGAAPVPIGASIGIDELTAGGLAAMPVPEPGPATLGVVALAATVALRRRRSGLPLPLPPQ